MAETKLTIPNLKFGFYYPEIMKNIQDYKDVYLKELNNSNPLDLSNQFFSVAAAIGHLSNCLIDSVANESLIDTAKNPDIVRRHLKSMGYNMSAATPARSSVVFELTTDFTSGLPKTILPVESTFGATNSKDESVSFYTEENLVLYNSTVTPTHVYVYEKDAGTPYLDITTDALSKVTPGDDVATFTSVNQPGDAFYIGHEDVMFNEFDIIFSDGNLSSQGVWEYYSGDFEKARPDSVTQIGGFLRMYINGYLGDASRDGTNIRVVNKSNGFYEDVVSYWDGTNNIVETNTLLNQSTVNTDITNYTIGSAWEPITSDEPMFFGSEALVTNKFDLPQSVNENWKKTEIDGNSAYWIRYRLTESFIGTPPTLNYVEFTEDSSKFMEIAIKQGRIQYDSGYSANGTPNQKFKTTKTNFIDDGNEVFTANGVDWTRVDNFISSSPTDKHYIVEFDVDNIATFIVGDGVNGLIPAVGSANVDIKYQYGAEEDGNVSALAIDSSTSGASFIKGIYNPRAAYGWSASDYSSIEAIEQAKLLASQQRRIIDVALNPSDVEVMAQSFTGSDGNSRFSRVFAYSDLEYPVQGYKTMKLVVVLKGGAQATTEELDEIAEYFNGNKTSSPTVRSRLVSGQKLFASNYVAKEINIKVNVTTKGFVDLDTIKNKLIEVINPEAKDSDGNYVWNFLDTVSVSRIKHYIHESSNKITKVDVEIPVNDIGLSPDELPTIGSISIQLN